MTTVTEGARFRVNRVLRIGGRPGIFACGDVVEGTVAAGMNLHWPLPGESLTTYAPIASVDYLDAERGAARAEVALGIRFERDVEDMEKLLEDLLEVGMIVDVRQPERHGS